ncbi:hypothetical protein SAMN02799616_04613 [Paenibacillus sp. UNC499MF]|nr:hypothetical protein SAMN02799616_04613 [Paenibacillus sp. UNC499MF]
MQVNGKPAGGIAIQKKQAYSPRFRRIRLFYECAGPGGPDLGRVRGGRRFLRGCPQQQAVAVSADVQSVAGAGRKGIRIS